MFSNQALTFVDDKLAALREMHRILRPGGTVFVTGWAALSMCPAIDAAYRALEDVQAAKAARLGTDFVPFRHRPNPNFSLSIRQDFANLLADAGFDDVGVSTAKAS